MDLQHIVDCISQVETNERAAWDGTMERIQQELAEQGQQLWYDSATGLHVGPIAEDEEGDDEQE